LFESFTQEFLENEIGSHYGSKRKLELGLTYDQYSPHSRTLPVVVQDYFAPGTEDEILYNVVATDEKTFENIRSDRYSIVPQGMPTLVSILGWAQMDIPAIEGDPVQCLLIALKDFMSRYCEHKPSLPMVTPFQTLEETH
jgi:hypothetical protein